MDEATRAQLHLYRQWFEAVQDLSPAYLKQADYAEAARLYRILGIRLPNSITEKLPPKEEKHG